MKEIKTIIIQKDNEVVEIDILCDDNQSIRSVIDRYGAG